MTQPRSILEARGLTVDLLMKFDDGDAPRYSAEAASTEAIPILKPSRVILT